MRDGGVGDDWFDTFTPVYVLDGDVTPVWERFVRSFVSPSFADEATEDGEDE